ncbi:MAG: hypothetical protein M3Y40_02990 [Chloroflexota bacterium]|nr:hypothetical protein [Chloroflexota bacterium]
MPGGVPAAPVNTPVRMYEEMELRHYSQDGQWWLGGRSVSAGGVLQPVLGPLTSTGFQLEYLDNAGNVTGNASAVTSIRVRVRGLTDDAVRQAGGFGSIGHPEEGLVTQVLLRNSIRP